MSTYQIAAVSRMTGLSSDTIRAWERRHALIRPARTTAGVRLYSEAEVERLGLARTAVALGHAIRRAASMSDSELRELIDSSAAANAKPRGTAAAARETIDRTFEAIQAYDLVGAEGLLNAAAILFAPAELVVDVLSPLMREIGEAWLAGRITVAQEHFASNLVRSLLGSLARIRPSSAQQAMLFVTPPGDLHELGIHFAAVLASLRGFRAIVLGTCVPAEETVRAAQAVHPKSVVIGLLHWTRPSEACEYIAHVRAGVPQQTGVRVGGNAALELPRDSLPAQVDVVESLSDFAVRAGRPS